MKRILSLIAATLLATVAMAQSVHVISWVAPTQYVDGTPLTEALTYNVYQYESGAWVKVANNVNALLYSISVPVGTSDYEVTAVTADGRESALSAMATVTVPAPPKPLPGVPTGVTIK